MGIRYSPILYLGRTFESEEDALEFYQRHFKLSEQDLGDIKVDGFGEWMYGHPKLSFERTSYYTQDCGYILGFNLAPYVKYPDTFTSAVQDKVEDWRVMFGDEPYSIIHDICVS